MKPSIYYAADQKEIMTDERCLITELLNLPGGDHLSIARARVEPGVTTAWHKLIDITERYLIISGTGLVELENHEGGKVGPGDVVVIPPNCRQRIKNDCDTDLVFYCICTPGFTAQCYINLD